MDTYERVIVARLHWASTIAYEDAMYPCVYANLALALAYYEFQLAAIEHYKKINRFGLDSKSLLARGWNGQYEQSTEPFKLKDKIRKLST